MVWLDGCSVYFSQALLICLVDIKPNGEETKWQQQVCRKDLLSSHGVAFMVTNVSSFLCLYKYFETPFRVLLILCVISFHVHFYFFSLKPGSSEHIQPAAQQIVSHRC